MKETRHRPARGSARYHAIRRTARAYRRMTRKPLFLKLPVSPKWAMIFFLVIVPALYLIGFLVERTHTNYFLLIGPHGGSRYAVGQHIAEVLNKPDKMEQFLHLNIVPDFIPKETCGSLDNIFYINQGQAELGFAEDGLPMHFEVPPACAFGMKPTELPARKKSAEIRVRALMPLYISPLHIVARKELGLTDVRGIPTHATVYMGPEGSATAVIASLLLDHYDIPVDRQGKNFNFDKALEEMIEGKIDVGFFLVGLNAKAMQKLAQHPQLKLLTVEHGTSLKFLYPYLEVVTIPGTTYKNASKDIPTVGTKTVLITSTDLKDHEVYEIADKLSRSIHDIIKDVPFNATKVTDSDPQKELYYPLHEGAVRFYKHNPPFFLDPHTLAGIGSYLTVMFALYKVSTQFVRNYRIHRILQAVELAVLASRVGTAHPHWKRYEFYTRKVKLMALAMLRYQRITMEDYERIDAYIKGHWPARFGGAGGD